MCPDCQADALEEQLKTAGIYRKVKEILLKHVWTTSCGVACDTGHKNVTYYGLIIFQPKVMEELG